MRALLQRVTEAQVQVEGRVIGSITKGLLIFLGIAPDDTEQDIEYLVCKISALRIFSDVTGKFMHSVAEVQGSVLIVSQFTLYADCARGRRPDFTLAAQPEKARGLYELFVAKMQATGIPVRTGEFGAHMEVKLTNDGPVTILLESKRGE